MFVTSNECYQFHGLLALFFESLYFIKSIAFELIQNILAYKQDVHRTYTLPVDINETQCSEKPKNWPSTVILNSMRSMVLCNYASVMTMQLCIYNEFAHQIWATSYHRFICKCKETAQPTRGRETAAIKWNVA